ncbi:hypothetical protein FRX31_022831 [Thalictrum thalictroides]|uniref:Uncharacterized protein n=1 Tax=Thalictrum thalictroides TaxID=46969 RepID=A0A7J6VRT2_THATH|nr:hypothetical protein FRX31_022831 [Thalictrum thalictroides]
MEPLPCPQPTWSTTPPSIHPPPLVPMEMIHEFEWGDNLASSYTWWIGFLKSLDGKKGNIQHENEGKHPLLFGEGIHHNKFHNSPKHGDLHFNNMGMEDQTSVLDEWLTVPASDEISDQK